MSFIAGLTGNAGVVSAKELTMEYEKIIIEGEFIEIGFKLFRDVFIFTNKRLILVDRQGLTGKKTEYLSILYKSIARFSIETAGHFDLDAELKIWISSENIPSVSKKFNREVNIYDVQKVLAYHLIDSDGSRRAIPESASEVIMPEIKNETILSNESDKSMEERRCSQCGAELPEGRRNCSKCGKFN
ncbi:MAG: PH domain-containing protein [Clostridiales bacterium]|nr:PH domain-containing protein [Clostridiales bacterium]